MLKRKGLILISTILTASIVLSGCAPLYRFIKGKDPDRMSVENYEAGMDKGYTEYLMENESAIVKDTLDIMVLGKNSRLPGMSGEKKSLDFAGTFLEANNYSSSRNYFEISYELKNELNIEDSIDHEPYESLLLDNSGRMPKMGEFEVVNGYGGTEDDIAYLDLENRYLLVEKKYRNLTEIAKEVSEKNCAGILYYVNDADTLPRDVLNESFDIPVFSITYEDAGKIRDYIDNMSPYTVNITDQPLDYSGTSSVLIAKPRDFDETKDTVLITADIDSSYSPGANRNASAVAAALHMAQKVNTLTDKKVNYVFAINGAGSVSGKEQLYYYMDQGLKASVKKVIELTDLAAGDTIKISTNRADSENAFIKKAADVAKKINMPLETETINENDVFTDNGYDTVRIERTGDELAGTDKDTSDRIDMVSYINVINLIMNAMIQ